MHDDPHRPRGMGSWVFWSLLVVGCAVERTPPPAAIDASIADPALEVPVRDQLQSYYASFSARNWTAFADHFWPGATIATVWQPPGAPEAIVDVQTVPAFVARAPEGPGSKPIFEERMTGAQIRVHGNLAHAWAGYEARFGDSTGVMEWRGIDAFTLLRHDGRWRIVSLAFTDVDNEVTDRR